MAQAIRPAVAIASALTVLAHTVLQATPAAADGTAFAAKALEQHPSGAMRHGRLFYDNGTTRYEYSHMGTPVVEIERPAEGLRLLLFPAARTYFEFKGAPRVTRENSSPCTLSGYASCEKVGEEEIGGIDAEVWKLTSAAGDAVTIWWDDKRKLSVREEHPGGRRMHGLRREHDDYEGLDAEQWEFTYLLPHGRYLGGMAVIAKDVASPVIERHPDGLVRRLFDIRRGDIPDDMFSLPQGYRRIEMPNAHPGTPIVPNGAQPMPWPPSPTAFSALHEPQIIPPPLQILQGDTARR